MGDSRNFRRDVSGVAGSVSKGSRIHEESSDRDNRRLGSGRGTIGTMAIWPCNSVPPESGLLDRQSANTVAC